MEEDTREAVDDRSSSPIKHHRRHDDDDEPHCYASPSMKRGKYEPPSWTQTSAMSSSSPASAQQQHSPLLPPLPLPLPPPQPTIVQQYLSSSQVNTSTTITTSCLELPLNLPTVIAGVASSMETPPPPPPPLPPPPPPPRKGKFVSPVWKPLEMLALAKAWRIQYCSSDHQPSLIKSVAVADIGVVAPPLKAKSRLEKDWDVAEYLKQQGVQRDAKTAATKWDNMLGDFRRVHEWEKGPERESAAGKSYFRLSPQERKMFRLPATFDKDVYEEMAQYVGHKPRSQFLSQRGDPQTGDSEVAAAASSALQGSASDIQLIAREAPDTEKDVMAGAIVQYRPSSAAQTEMHRVIPIAHGGGGAERISRIHAMQSTPCRIGKIKMVWEESIHIWGEEGGDDRHGRLKMESLNFLHADELVFLDENFTGNAIEMFEDGPLQGFSSDSFTTAHHLKVFGRRKHGSSSQPHLPAISAAGPCTPLRDRTSYFLGCLKSLKAGLPSLSALASYLKQPPPQEYRFPLRSDVYEDLPAGKEAFFVASSEADCREIIYEVVAPLIRSANMGWGREFLMSLWDDCINRVVKYFCADEVELIRNSSMSELGRERASVCGLLRRLCLWRGEEKGVLMGSENPRVGLVSKLLWTYGDMPYILAYYAIGTQVTFCALSRDGASKVTCTDLATMSLSNPAERLCVLAPCWHVAQLLSLLADLCSKMPNVHSDYETIQHPDGKVVEVMFSQVKKTFPNRRRWAAVKDIYDLLQDNRVPYVDCVCKAEEAELALFFRPRGHPIRPATIQQLLEALKCVCTALLALHSLSIMHRDVRWENVLKQPNADEWFLVDFEHSVEAPQMYPYNNVPPGMHCAPEMLRGCHGLKVDVWGIGYLIKSSGVCLLLHHPLRDLQHRCMDLDPDQRPPLGDCFFHLVQLLQSSLQDSS